MPGSGDAFVIRLNATGSSLVYSTYLGGSDEEFSSEISVDSSGNAYITGSSKSTAFPTTPGAYQTNLSGVGDIFVTKLNASGTALEYSTYLGGGLYEAGMGIAVNAAGNAYVTGYTSSPDFPTTAGAFQPQDSADEG